MDGKELFERSKPKKGQKQKLNTLGLPIRVYNSLDHNFRKLGLLLDKYNILAVVLDGRIWHMRNIGIVAVRQICDWLAPQLDEDNKFKEEL